MAKQTIFASQELHMRSWCKDRARNKLGNGQRVRQRLEEAHALDLIDLEQALRVFQVQEKMKIDMSTMGSCSSDLFHGIIVVLRCYMRLRGGAC
jgi:hypothetical protein